MNDEIKILMQKLDLTEEEATELYNEDKRIDKMTVAEAKSDLTASQQRAIKKYTNCDRAVNAYGKEVKRTRKEDNDKQKLVNLIENALRNEVDNLKVTNKERELTFTFNNRNFKIVLSAPRS